MLLVVVVVDGIGLFFPFAQLGGLFRWILDFGEISAVVCGLE